MQISVLPYDIRQAFLAPPAPPSAGHFPIGGNGVITGEGMFKIPSHVSPRIRRSNGQNLISRLHIRHAGDVTWLAPSRHISRRMKFLSPAFKYPGNAPASLHSASLHVRAVTRVSLRAAFTTFFSAVAAPAKY